MLTMLRASFTGLLVAMGLNLVLVLLAGVGSPSIGVLIPGLTGGLMAGFIAKRGLRGGLFVGGLMALLMMFFWMIAIAKGVGVPPMYEATGDFPGVGTVVLNVTLAGASAIAGGLVGGLLREVLPRWREKVNKSRSAPAQSNYYKR